MSSFNGEIKEIVGISVDNFVKTNQKCYFLSHCHSDHLRGLCLLITNANIYLSALSALFIRKKFPQLEKNIKVLELGIPTYIEIEKTSFTVTALPAGHCAGALMLLFQIEGCDILYTGDYRMSIKNARRMKILENIAKNDCLSIYLDSTFLKTSYPNFPSQTTSVDKIIDIVAKFLNKSENNKVNLWTPARYGYEYLLIELYSRLKSVVYIHESEVYEEYSFISDLEKCITKHSKNARIFVKPTYLNFKSEDGRNFLNIWLSAMFWKNWNGGPFELKTSDNSYRVCYATHNSYREIYDFLSYLKPKKIRLNVLPPDEEEKRKMINLIDSIQQNYSKANHGEEEPSDKIETRKFSFKKINSTSQRAQIETKKLKL